MEKGLLICSGAGKQKNIGDYIQSVAQEQFIGRDYCYVEREKLNSFKSGKKKIKLIMNGWFMWNPENFPPSEDIIPLFISFHIVPSIAQRLLTNNCISYLKRFEPIGTRDTGTKKLLQSHGIDSYFSGCLTLTLGKDYKNEKKDGGVVFVDPYFEFGGNYNANIFVKIGRAIFYSVKYKKQIAAFSQNFNCDHKTRFGRLFPKLERVMMAASFYNSYKLSFSDQVLTRAHYISHTVNQSDFKGDDEKMEYARKLIRQYAKARLIITSRIHCALPALGLETPVIFVNSERLRGGRVRSSGRFGGLIELMHVMEWTPNAMKAITPELSKVMQDNRKIGEKTDISVMTSYKKYAKEMSERVCDFLKK